VRGEACLTRHLGGDEGARDIAPSADPDGQDGAGAAENRLVAQAAANA
jgi:hypothetical protein